MRVLGSSVLVMESLLMGFAILIAKDGHSSTAIIVGSIISFLIFLNAGMMRSMRGWYIGTILQIAMIAYGTVVPMMYFMGGLFAILWGFAFFLGRKGEAMRAALIAEKALESGSANPQK